MALSAEILEARIAQVKEDQHAETEDLMSSAPNLWPPRGVVKKHRSKAAAIWIALLACFFAYVVYVIVDSYGDRNNPAASVTVKQEYYTFPDMLLCAFYGEGCYTYGEYCFEFADIRTFYTTGFEEAKLDYTSDNDTTVGEIEDEYPHCKVLALSKLTVNETGVKNRKINHLSVGVQALWMDDPYGQKMAGTSNKRFIRTFFFDLDEGLEGVKDLITDAKIPYDVINLEQGEEFSMTYSHMMMSYKEFVPIGSTGGHRKKQKTYQQRTTSGVRVLVWNSSSITIPWAFMQTEILIPEFAYEVIKEVDPVDPWAIVGSIGGFWQIVCIAFGLFFVFSIKQAPDRKMRNFKKSAKKTVDPVIVIGKRLSLSTSKQPRDVVVDVTDEDLPDNWVKKRRVDGTCYYFNVLTGDWQSSSPNDGPFFPDAGGIVPAHQPEEPGDIPSSAVKDRAVVRSQAHVVASVFRRNSSQKAEALPPGWVARTDSDGRSYYVDTVRKTSQWDRPSHTRSGPKMEFPSRHRVVEVVDVPTSRHTSRSWAISSSLRPKGMHRSSAPPLPARETPATSAGSCSDRSSAPPLPARDTPATGSGSGSVAETKETEDVEELPPGWEMKRTDTGRTFYMNHVQRTTQYWRNFPSRNQRSECRCLSLSPWSMKNHGGRKGKDEIEDEQPLRGRTLDRLRRGILA